MSTPDQRNDHASENPAGAPEPALRAAQSRAWSSEHGPGLLFGSCALVALAWLGYQRWLGVPPAPAEFASLVIVLVAGFVSGVAGFAFSAIAGGGFAHFDVGPVQAVEIMALCSIAIQLYSVIAIRRDIRWRCILPFIAGGFTTLPLGTFLLTHISIPLFDLVLGIFLLAYGVKGLAGPIRKGVSGNWRIDFVVGALGGITGGIAAFPGAFVTIWCTMRGWDKATARGVYQPYILVLQLAAVAWMRAESVPFVQAETAIPCVAVALLAAHLGLLVFRRLGNEQFARIVAALLAISGAALLARAF